MKRKALLGIAVALLLGSCGEDEVQPIEGVALEKRTWSELEGWSEVDLTASLRALERSCTKISNLSADIAMGRDGVAGKAGDWHPICDAVAGASSPNLFFETWFDPYSVTADGETQGLYTGYYEPLLNGSREPIAPYSEPLRLNPMDMVTVNLGDFDPELKGRRFIGRVDGDKLEPYPDRAGIDAGQIDAQAPPFLWVDDAIAKFFLQIQGSGLVKLRDGETIRVGYAGQNGHSYRAIGRDLIEMGALTRENVSLQTIRQWLIDNPANADEIMHKNASYIFFRELSELNDASGPLGSHNVPLEPYHSLAVDRSFWPMGLPVWLDLSVPYQEGELPFQQLLIAQDTGGAIKGAIRGDVFWGAGPLAEFVAGHMKSKGGMVVLLPRSASASS